MVGKVQRAKETVEERIPDLLVRNHSVSSALHPLTYVGPLQKWTTFEHDVKVAVQQQSWGIHTSTITIRPVGALGPHNTANEQVLVGDENGVQGRFQQNVGHVMSAVFGSQGLDLRFGDFKAAGSTYRRTPDVVIINSQNHIKVVCELKCPWIDEHILIEEPTTTSTTEHQFRSQIGQLARYMHDLQVGYGVYSTYRQHVFFKQECIAGRWVLRYSPVISDTTNSESELTVRQCFFFLGHEAGRTLRVVNSTPPGQWVVKHKRAS
ncbi:hypothetical protein MYU51_008553 [Penicillium brevicompactum]